MCLLFIFTNLLGKDIRIWIYFSPPSNLSSYLTTLLNRATVSVDGAFYRIDDPNLIDSLIRTRDRGIRVRLVVDKGCASSPIKELIDAGIEVISNEGTDGLMHNKFMVVDGRYVWTGSYNLTSQGLREDNDAILIDSSLLAKRYLDEFDEFLSGVFSGGAKTTGGKVYVDDTEIEVYFAPEDDVKEKIVKEIRKAQKSIHFAYYSFSDEDYSDEIIERFKNGVIVEGVVDDTASAGEEAVSEMYDAGIGVIRSHPLAPSMHHKFMIIDMKKVIAGSFNLSEAANEENDENILIIHGDEVAQTYYAEFKRLYGRPSRAEDEVERIHYLYTKPNPASTHTIITYNLGLYPDEVKIKVFDVAGDLVKSVDDAPSSPGHNEYQWDLKNDEGWDLANGVYIIQVEAITNGRIVSGFTKLAILRR